MAMVTPQEERVIRETLEELIENNYRNRNGRAVIHEVLQRLQDKGFNASARDFRVSFCTYDASDRPGAEKQRALGERNFGKELADLYGKANRLAEGEGSFQMPEWGVSGT